MTKELCAGSSEKIHNLREAGAELRIFFCRNFWGVPDGQGVFHSAGQRKKGPPKRRLRIGAEKTIFALPGCIRLRRIVRQKRFAAEQEQRKRGGACDDIRNRFGDIDAQHIAAHNRGQHQRQRDQ